MNLLLLINIISIYQLKTHFIYTYILFSNFYSFLQHSFKENTLQDQLAGPIGIVKNADQMMLDQFWRNLFLFIVISLFVGLFNLLPIPMLRWRSYIVFHYKKNFFKLTT